MAAVIFVLRPGDWAALPLVPQELRGKRDHGSVQRQLVKQHKFATLEPQQWEGSRLRLRSGLDIVPHPKSQPLHSYEACDAVKELFLSRHYRGTPLFAIYIYIYICTSFNIVVADYTLSTLNPDLNPK